MAGASPGVTHKARKNSTLSYASEHRPAQLYEDLFYTAFNRFRDEEGLGQRKKKFRFKNQLLSLDSTTISPCLKLFPWAKFRRAKGGVKTHVLLDHGDYLPRSSGAGTPYSPSLTRTDVGVGDRREFILEVALKSLAPRRGP